MYLSNYLSIYDYLDLSIYPRQAMGERERETWYIYVYMYIHTYIACFEEEKKAQKNPAAAGRGNPGPLPSIRSRDDIIHLQTPNTF